jgi:putative peptidoglycan lipid II flippase
MVKYANSFKNFFVQTQNTILSAAFVISVFYFLSSILGILKSRVIVHFFGASDALGIFFIADRIPTAIYSTIFLGTFSSVFIPVFLSLSQKDFQKAYEYSSNLLNHLLLIFGVISVILFILAEDIINGLTLGQASFSDRSLGGNFLRIMLLGQFILIISSFVSSFLNAKKQFLVTSMAPVFFNLVYLVSIPLLFPFFEIYSLALAMVIGSFFHLITQLPSLVLSGFRYSFVFKSKDKSLKETYNLSKGTLLTTLIGNTISLIENSMAFFISSGSVVYFKLADQLRYFPIHLFGASISIASLPILSQEFESENKERFNKIVRTSILQIIYLSLPVMILLVVLRLPLVRIFYGASKFTWEDTLTTALCLGIFALSILPQSISVFISKCFYAVKDTKTPLIASIISLFSAICFPIYFILNGYGVWVVVLAYVIGSYINIAYFMLMVRRNFRGFEFREMFISTGKMLMVGGIMSLVLYFPMRLIDLYVLDTSYVQDLLFLTASVSLLGFLVYIFLSYRLKIPEVILFFKVLRKFRIKSSLLDNLENQLNQSITS